MEPLSFEERVQRMREQQDKDREDAAKRADPTEREKLLRRAQEIVQEGDPDVSVFSPRVLAVARFLAGEPG